MAKNSILKKFAKSINQEFSTAAAGDKKVILNSIKDVKVKKQTIEELYKKEGKWTEKILEDWSNFMIPVGVHALRELRRIKTKYTGN